MISACDFRVIIPARLNSKRLPGKALLKIGDKPMIQHVYHRALESGAKSVVVATDDLKIKKCVEDFGGNTVLTASTHCSGTERLSEAVTVLGYHNEEIIVNLQGDEPLISPELIKQVACDLKNSPDASISTLCQKITDPSTLSQPDSVKVVMDKNGYALYFSRSLIPWSHAESTGIGCYYRHIGLYAYRADFIKRYFDFDHCYLEQAESLEQLRALWHNEKIHVVEACVKPQPEVNTPEQLEKVRLIYGSSPYPCCDSKG